MNRQSTSRPTALAAALLASLGVATAAWAASDAPPQRPVPATATVIADLHAPDGDVERAIAAAADRAGLQPADVRVRRTGGTLEATAQASALASRHPTVIAAAGRDARAAVAQASGAEISPATAWISGR